jgi:hypothetical protein
MPTDPKWKTFGETISVTLQLIGFDVETVEFTESVGLEPTSVRRGHWCYQSEQFVSSKNVNDHLQHLLRIFLPLKERLQRLQPSVAVVVCVNWRTNDPVGGALIIDSECISGLAQLGASLALDSFHQCES